MTMTFEKPQAVFVGLQAREAALDLPVKLAAIVATVLVAVGTTLQK